MTLSMQTSARKREKTWHSEYQKMSDRAGRAEVRENNALARIEELEKKVLPAILGDIADKDYESAVARIKTAIYAKKKEAD